MTGSGLTKEPYAMGDSESELPQTVPPMGDTGSVLTQYILVVGKTGRRLYLSAMVLVFTEIGPHLIVIELLNFFIAPSPFDSSPW